jgi:hypothetical protein
MNRVVATEKLGGEGLYEERLCVARERKKEKEKKEGREKMSQV